MDIDRRRFLGGSALTAGVLLASPIQAMTPLLDSKPYVAGPVLSPIFPPNINFMLRVLTHPKKFSDIPYPYVADASQWAHKISVEIFRPEPEDVIRVRSVEAVEDAYLAGLPGRDAVYMSETTDWVHHIDQNDNEFKRGTGFQIACVRAANRIAMVSRRGAGNRLLINPAMAGRIRARPTDERIGDWTRYEHDTYDWFNDNVWVSPRVPADRAYVTYWGNYTDAPGGITHDAIGRLMFLGRPAAPNLVGDGNSMGQVIRLVNL